MKRLLISADCHVTEPLDLWARQLPAGLRDKGPRSAETRKILFNQTSKSVKERLNNI